MVNKERTLWITVSGSGVSMTFDDVYKHRLSTHPFMDTFGGSGLPWETSTRTHPDSTLKRFLHDLDSYTPPQARTTPPVPGNRYKPDSDEDLLRVLEASRREYQADRQMQAGKHITTIIHMGLFAIINLNI